jgi:hypothetical protein
MSYFRVFLAFAAAFAGVTNSVSASQITAAIGFHDQTTPIGLVSGWALDPKTPTQALDVKIYLGGPIGSGKLLGTAKANVPRSDVNRALGYAGNHGFNFEIPETGSMGRQPIYVYAVKGENEFLLSGSPKAAPIQRTHERQVNHGSLWLNPPIGPKFDWKDLYRRPELWTEARQKLSVFQIQDAALAPATLPDDELALLVENLAGLDLRLALETGVVKHWGCSAKSVVPVALSYMHRVAQFQGTVDYIAMDEPLVARAANPTGCGLTMDEIATETAAYVNAVKQAYPATEIGDIEPWPGISKDELMEWIAKLTEKVEHKLAFFRLDVDCDLAMRDHHSTADLRELADFVRGRGMKFSVIVPVLSRISDSSARKYGLWCADRIHEATSIDNAIVQSWEAYPRSNLPEQAPNTLTAILNEYAAAHPPALLHPTIRSVPMKPAKQFSHAH